MRGRTTELTLPSGMKFVVRKPEPELLGVLDLSLQVLRRTCQPCPQDEISDEEAAGLAWAMGRVLLHCCVKPRISPAPQGPGEIAPTAMSFEDAVYVVHWALAREQEPSPERPRARMRHRSSRTRRV